MAAWPSRMGSLVADWESIGPVLQGRQGRRWDGRVPVIAVADGDAVPEALAAGADDCVPRHAPAEEIVLRMERLLTPAEAPRPERRRIGQVTVDVDLCEVVVEGRIANLSTIQYDILIALLENEGRVVGVPDLLEAAWDSHQEHKGGLLRPQLTRLRRILGDSVSIDNVRGRGYQLVDRRAGAEEAGA